MPHLRLVLLTPLLLVYLVGNAMAQSASTGPNALQLRDVNPHGIQHQNASQNWGSIRNGLRAGLAVGKSTYVLGEDIPLHISLQNVSVTSDLHDNHDSITVTVLNDDGPLRPQSFTGIETTSGPIVCPVAYTRGKPVTVEKTLAQFRFKPDDPGTYKIFVTWSPYEGNGKPCPDSHSVVYDAAPLPYASVISNPVFLKVTAGSTSLDWKLLSSEYTAWRRHFSLVDTGFGEKTALLDDATGLDWLRLNFTAGGSYEHVEKELRPGGQFEGWRVATPDEVRVLFAHFTGTPDGHSNDQAMERKFQRLLGGPLAGSPIPSHEYEGITEGFVGRPMGTDNNMIHYHVAYISEDMVRGIAIRPDDEMSAVPDYASPGVGIFLVREHLKLRSQSGHLR